MTSIHLHHAPHLSLKPLPWFTPMLGIPRPKPPWLPTWICTWNSSHLSVLTFRWKQTLEKHPKRKRKVLPVDVFCREISPPGKTLQRNRSGRVFFFPVVPGFGFTWGDGFFPSEMGFHRGVCQVPQVGTIGSCWEDSSYNWGDKTPFFSRMNKPQRSPFELVGHENKGSNFLGPTLRLWFNKPIRDSEGQESLEL